MNINIDQQEARALLLTLEIAAQSVQRVALKIQNAAQGEQAPQPAQPEEPVVVQNL